MRTIIKEAISSLLADRYVSVVCILLALSAIAFAIYIGVNVRPSELQLVSQYSAFGSTHLYRDQWYYLFSFGVLGLAVAAIHAAIVAKVILTKGHSLALLIAWSSVAMVMFAWMTAYAVLNVWSPV